MMHKIIPRVLLLREKQDDVSITATKISVGNGNGLSSDSYTIALIQQTSSDCADWCWQIAYWVTKTFLSSKSESHGLNSF